MSNELFICQYCNRKFERLQSFSKHLKMYHNITLKEYYEKYYKKPGEGICPVCGKETKFITFGKYCKYCSKKCEGNSEEFCNKQKELKLKFFSNEKNRKKHSEIIKNSEKHKNSSKLAANKISNGLKKYWSLDENRKLQSERIKNSDNHKKACSDVNTSIEFRKKISDIKTNAYKNKEYAERMKKLTHNENWRKSITSKKHREKISENNIKRILEGKVFKKYFYDNQWFDSKPELAFYIYLKDHNIKFKHEKMYLDYYFKGIKYKYVPDFIVYNTYVEIKGGHLYKKLLKPNTKDNAKYKCMLKNKVHIITNYEKYIIYVNNKYGNDYFKEFKKR